LAKYRSILKYGMLLCCLQTALLLCGTALAEEGIAAEDGRKDYQAFSDGLKFVEGKGPVYQNGLWSMTIDTAATDWTAVIAAGYHESQQISGVELQVFADPHKSASRVGTWGTSGTQQEMLEWLETVETMEPMAPVGSNSQYGSATVRLGFYDAASGKFFPEEIKRDEHRTFLIRFKYQDGTYDSRYVMAEVSFSSLEPVEVSIPAATVNEIIPNFGGTTLQAEVSPGRVEYRNATDDPQALTLITAVKAPGPKEETADWTAYDGDRKLDMDNDASGHAVACFYSDLPAEKYTESFAKVILWKDAQKNVKAMQRFSLDIVHGNLAPWPEYAEGLKPLAAADPSSVQLEMQGNVSGVTALPNGYTVHIGFDDEALYQAAADGENLSAAAVKVRIRAPQGAAFYTGAKTLMGGTNIYGPSLAQTYGASGYLTPSAEDAIPVTGEWVEVGNMGYLEQRSYVNPAGGTMHYYLAAFRGLATDLGGGVQIIDWFDRDLNLLERNYLVYTFENASIVTDEVVLEDESGMDASDLKPRVVIKGNWHKGHGKVVLHAERLLSSPGTHYYNLQLVGEDGAVIPVPKGEKCDVYLPYPEGYDRTKAQKEGLEITIGHYNDQMELVEDAFSVAKGNLELTPFGMRLRVSGFSPFVVGWRTAEPAPLPTSAVPKTGDAFPLSSVLLLGLLAVSGMMLLGGIKRRA